MARAKKPPFMKGTDQQMGTFYEEMGQSKLMKSPNHDNKLVLQKTIVTQGNSQDRHNTKSRLIGAF